MTHKSVHEWGRVPVGEGGFTRAEANRLLAAARAHPCGGVEGTAILVDHHTHLTARQVVGVLAARGCSLEILPKVDPASADEDDVTVRRRLIGMLDVALGLDLSSGGTAQLARQGETLLDILIRLFADRLLDEVRRGLPRRYQMREDDLPALRGQMDVVRQFTRHAVRPDWLACRFDTLEADTPLLRIMKAAVVFLGKHARAVETRRRLTELRHLLDDVRDISPASLPWDRVQLDRSNRRWRSLHDLARLFLMRDWQATHHRDRAGEGITLLFPMNDLFETYIAALLRRALAGSDLEMTAQGGLQYCLGDWPKEEQEPVAPHLFQTRPDIVLRRAGRIVAIVDTKWKALAEPFTGKGGVSQADVYQLMAYAKVYGCRDLMLLYPGAPDGIGVGLSGERASYHMAGGGERLRIAQIDVAQDRDAVVADLRDLFGEKKRLVAAATGYRTTGPTSARLATGSLEIG